MMMRLIFVLIAGVATLSASAAPGPRTVTFDLAQDLTVFNLEPRVLTMLNHGEPRPLTVCDLVTMSWWTLEQDKFLVRHRVDEIKAAVRAAGLELYLTAEEVNGFRRDGVVPAPGLASRVDRLPLSFGARGLLRKLNFSLIRQLRGVTREMLARNGGSVRVVNEITEAVKPVGVTIWKNELEQRITEAGRRAENAVPIDRVGLPKGDVRLLQREDIWNVRELIARDRAGDLTQLVRFGPQAHARVAEVMLRHGHVAAWTHAIGDLGLPPDITQALINHGVKTRKALRSYVESGQFAVLMNNDALILRFVTELLSSDTCGRLLDDNET